MMKKRITYANVMATMATFLALGGVGYAASNLPANSVGTKQLQKEAVTAAKIKNGTISGAKVDPSTLGTVPSAAHATSADHASSADRATTATTATRAGVAGTAETLGGKSTSQIVDAARPACPAGTKPEFGLCFEVTERNPNLLISAIAICSKEGRWLPELPQIIAFQERNYADPQPEEWSNEIYSAGGYEWGYVAHTEATGSSIGPRKSSESKAYRCVVAPS